MAEWSRLKTSIAKLGLLLSGGRAALSNLRRRMSESRTNAGGGRLDSLERAVEIQTALNESVEVQIKLIYGILEKVQKRLQIVTIALIATATIAALALAAIWMR